MKALLKKLFDLRGELGGQTGVTLADGKDLMAVNGNVTYYTKAIQVSKMMYFGLWLQAASTGTPNLQIDYQQSYKAPAVEGAADANFVIPDGASAIYSNLNDTTAHVKQITPVPMTWVRFKITGGATNPADCALTMKLFLQAIN